MKCHDNKIVYELFEYSKRNSEFNFYSKIKNEPPRVKIIGGNTYYKLKTKNEKFRIGYEYSSKFETLALAIVPSHPKHSGDIDDALDALNTIISIKQKDIDDMNDNLISSGRGIVVNSMSVPDLFNLQEMLLIYLSNKT